MPIKRIASMTASTTQSKHSLAKTLQVKTAAKIPSLSNICIFMTIIVFAISVSLRVSDNLEKNFGVTDAQAKTCMIEFSAKNCNPLGMDEECSQIFRYSIEITTKLLSLLLLAYGEVKENGFIPAAIIIVILLYQIVKSMKAKEEPEENGSAE